LEAGGKTYRDYYINLDFVGQRTIILPEPTTERMLGEFRPAHANYAFKAAMYHFDYHGIIALNIRWMRTGRTPMACTVAQIEALTEIATPLKQPVLEIGTEKFALPVKLDADDYAEFQGKGDIRIFDKQGRLLQTIQPDGRVPVLPAGPSRIGLRAAEGGAAKLTLITLGDPLPPPPASAPAREP